MERADYAIDFIPFVGVPNLADHVHRLGQWAKENTTRPEEGEVPGHRGELKLGFTHEEEPFCVWVGVRWDDELEARDSLDEWTQETLEQHPGLAYAVVMRHLKPMGTAATMWLRWPGATEGVEGYRIQCKDWANDDGVEMKEGEFADLSEVMEYAMNELPAIQSYWQARQSAKDMGERLPAAKAARSAARRM